MYDSRFKRDFKGSLCTMWLGPYKIDQVFDNGTVRLTTIDKKWTPLFDANSESIDKISVSVQFLGLPLEFWNPTPLKYLGNALGIFMEEDLSFLKTCQKSMERILVSSNICTELREDINLIWGITTRQQLLDYEGLSFRFHRCHKVEH